MEILKTELRYQNRTLRQLKRQGMIAIYEVIGPNKLTYGYEVIIVQIAAAREIFGKFYPEREVYPSSSKESSDWGRVAWSFGRNFKDDAFLAFERLASEPMEA